MAAAQAGVKPRVSVITIFYNAEAHFREAIESVLTQGFADFELLLVDDGSTDSSTQIARDYEARDDRVRYLGHPGHVNRGMSATRNLGLSEARGELIAFIDADDRWRANKLVEQVELMDRMPDVDAVGGSVNYWASETGGPDRVIPTAHVRNRPILPGEATLALYPLGKADAPSMSDLMFRREAIRKVGGFEETFRGAYEDQAFLAKFYLGSTLYITDQLWSDYRLHENSCMAQVGRSERYHDARRAFLEWFEEYLEGTRYWSDPRYRRAIERALRPYRSRTRRLADAVRSVPLAVAAVRGARSAYRRLRPLIAPGPAILMYHRIADEEFDPWALAVSPANFEEQLDWIARNRTPLPLDEFAELHRQGKLPRNAIAVTFDDGYACSARAAAPLLARFGVPATIFISPDLIRRGEEFWWDQLERIVLSHKADSLRVDGSDVTLGPRDESDVDWPAETPPRTPRQHAYKRIWSKLYGGAPPKIEGAISDLRKQAGISKKARDTHRPMTADEIRAMPSLISFGSHALSHPSLPLLPPDEQAREIEGSVGDCEKITGHRPRTFAYPYGDHSPSLEPMVENAGFACACRADGWFVTRKSNRFALPRIFVGNSGASQLALRLGRP